MNEFRRYQPGDVIERADLIRLRPGTIIKAEHDDRPTYVGKDGDFERYAAIPDEAVKLPELPDEDYLVLYVPPVPLPGVGGWVSLEQLDALPLLAIVQDGGSLAQPPFQKIALGSGELPESWAGVGFEGDSHALWQHARGQLSLLWLPAEPHKG